MKLRYTATTKKECGHTEEEERTISIAEAIDLPVQFTKDGMTYTLFPEDLVLYAMHKYAPIMTFRTHQAVVMETYAELYEINPQTCLSIILQQGEDNFYDDIAGMLQELDKQAEQSKQSDLYQQGRVDY